MKIRNVLLIIVVLTTFSGCVSTTVINSVPPKAKVFINNEFKGYTPYQYSDSKISGAITDLRLEKYGYVSFPLVLRKNEKVNGGAVFSGILFGLWPFLWTMEYNPERTYELKRNLDIPPSKIDSTELVTSIKTNTEESISHDEEALKTKEFRQLQELKKLFNDSIITSQEYESEKNKILDPFHSPTWPFPFRNYHKLRELKTLLDQGTINKDDFYSEKKRIVGSVFYKFYIKK